MTFCACRRVICCDSSRESSWLKQFRRTYPSNANTGAEAWRKRPLNRQVFTPLTEEQKRKALRDPKKDYDPYARLEFFTHESVNGDLLNMDPRTALPKDTPMIVRATEARQTVLNRLHDVYIEGLHYQLREGEIDEKDLAELVKDYHEFHEDPSTPFLLEQALNGIVKGSPIYPDPEDLHKIDMSKKTFVERLTYLYNVPGCISFENVKLHDNVRTPIVRMTHSNGEEAVISLHGGCILSWKDKKGRNSLFNHPEQVYDNKEAINKTGITFVFPQFGRIETFPLDGFANRLLWDVVRTEVSASWDPDPEPSVTLFCKDNEETRSIWPYNFEIYYKITLGESDDDAQLRIPRKDVRRFARKLRKHRTVTNALEAIRLEDRELRRVKLQRKKDEERGRSWRRQRVEEHELDEPEEPVVEILPTQLRLQFTIRNTGDKPMEFMCATRGHFKNREPRLYGEFIRILGLNTRYYLDYHIVQGRPVLRRFEEDYLRLMKRPEGWNAIFTENALNDIYFCDGNPDYYESIARLDFSDLLVYQPSAMTGGLYGADNNMTMVGRGNVTVPIRLKPGEKWEGEHVIRHHEKYFPEPVFGYQETAPPPYASEIERPPKPAPWAVEHFRG